MCDPGSWRSQGKYSAQQIEAYLDAVSRTRSLTLEESLKLEWAITAQTDASRDERRTMLASQIEDLALADRLEDEMHRR